MLKIEADENVMSKELEGIYAGLIREMAYIQDEIYECVDEEEEVVLLEQKEILQQLKWAIDNWVVWGVFDSAKLDQTPLQQAQFM